jgi:hypothetical protein
MRVDPYLMKCRGLTARIRGDSSATGVKLRGPERSEGHVSFNGRVMPRQSAL